MVRKLAIIAALVATPAVAQDVVDPTIHWCDGCDGTQERALVYSFNGNGNLGRFAYYIGNLNERTLHKYVFDVHVLLPNPGCTNHKGCIPMSVGHESKDNVITPQFDTEVTLYPAEVEGDIVEAFNNAVQFYYTEPMGWKKEYDVQFVDSSNPQSSAYKKFYRDGTFVPQANSVGNMGPLQTVPVVDFPDPNANVYDVAVIGAKQNQFLDYFLTPGGEQFKVASGYLLKIFSYVGLFNADNLPVNVINVSFADGSKVTIKLDISTTSPRYVIDENSGRDSHNNFVPIRQSQLQDKRSTFSFGGEGNPHDRSSSYQQLRGLGVDMGPVSPQAESWQCGPLGNGGQGVTCVQLQ